MRKRQQVCIPQYPLAFVGYRCEVRDSCFGLQCGKVVEVGRPAGDVEDSAGSLDRAEGERGAERCAHWEGGGVESCVAEVELAEEPEGFLEVDLLGSVC